ncbi:MAG: SBBP repeat-containing protein [Candidatus Syntrophosphaera sp.]|nr:SBBP repeat-containing protein [Candidatus Syntrophosphaera sp.]
MNGMKGFLLCVALLCLALVLTAQTPQWGWAVNVVGNSNNYSESIATDDYGNQYITGSFTDTAVFGPISLTSISSSDLFIAKLDANGNWLWANRAGGVGSDSGRGISVDSEGNIYVTGNFAGEAVFGPLVLVSSGLEDVFVAKLDTNGNWLWAQQAGSPANDNAFDICVDSQGSSYVTGYIKGNAIFGDETLICQEYRESIFVAKLGQTGEWIWARNTIGTSSSNQGHGIACDNNGSVYVTGDLSGTTEFGSITITGLDGIFVAKLDSSGNWLWASGASSTDGSTNGDDISLDINGNIYVTGWLYRTAVFGSTTVVGGNHDNALIAKLNNDGEWQWAKASTMTSARSHGIFTDGTGNSYCVGYFTNTICLGPYQLTSLGSGDIFVTMLDTVGNWKWAYSAGGSGYNACYAIDVDPYGNCYVVGLNYEYQSMFFGDITITNGAGNDVFVAKLNPPNPRAFFTANITEGLEPLTVQFTDASIIGAGPIIAWLWDFGDGNQSVLPNPSHTYLDSGVYTVSLSVVNYLGLTGYRVVDDYISVYEPFREISLLSSTSVNFGTIIVDTESDYQAITFSNTGNVDLTISDFHFVSTQQHFEFMDPFRNLMLSPGEIDSVMVRFVPQTVGALSDTLYIVSDAENNPLLKVNLMGTGIHVPPCAPENPIATMDGNNVVLSWDPVTQTIFNTPVTPDYYLIFHSIDPFGQFTFLGATNGLQYIHPMVGAFQSRMFYHVLAYKYYGRGVFDPACLVQGMTEAEVLEIMAKPR